MLALNFHLFVETHSTVIPLWSGCHVQAQCLRSDVVAAPGQTTLLCFALQAVCGSIKQSLCMKEQVEEGGGRQASEWEQPENRRWLLTFTWTPSVGKGIGRGGDKTREKASNPEARARDGGECVIVVTTATACRPGGAGGAWRKVRRLRCSQLNQLWSVRSPVVLGLRKCSCLGCSGGT